MRVALYYAPDRDDPLWTAGCAWRGRDPTGIAAPPPAGDDLSEVTEQPRRYGFHATLKAPMRLAAGHHYADVLEQTRALAASLAPFALPPLAVTALGGFLALCETIASPPLQALADAATAWVDPLRAPPDAAELARRRAALLPADEANLRRWGYPFVFGAWRFHMTLTRRLEAAEMAVLRPRAEAHFRPALARTRRVEAIWLFTEAEPGAPFRMADRVRLGP